MYRRISAHVLWQTHSYFSVLDMSELQASTALCTCIIACVLAACFAIRRRFEVYSWPIILSPSQSSDTCKQTLECVGCQVLCMHTIIVQMLAINLSCVNCKTMYSMQYYCGCMMIWNCLQARKKFRTCDVSFSYMWHLLTCQAWKEAWNVGRKWGQN